MKGMVACMATNQPKENLSKCSRQAPKGMLVAAATSAMDAILTCSACTAPREHKMSESPGLEVPASCGCGEA